MSDGFTLPAGIPFAERVPKAGASCKTCDFLGKDGQSCTNAVYIRVHGGADLGAKAKRWCCSVWTPEGGR